MEAGFSEIELYEPMPKLDGFIQNLGNDQFMYDWIVYSREAQPQLSLYYWDGVRCRVLTEPMDGVCVSWYVQSVPVEWNELQEVVNRHMTGQWIVMSVQLVYTNCTDSMPMW